MIEYAWRRVIATWRDVDTGLLVEPPFWQAKFVGYFLRCLEHHSMRMENRINVPCRPPGIVGKGHCGTADDVDIGDHAASSKPVPEQAERPRNLLTV